MAGNMSSRSSMASLKRARPSLTSWDFELASILPTRIWICTPLPQLKRPLPPSSRDMSEAS